MELKPGAELGLYEILSQIGAGGMGLFMDLVGNWQRLVRESTVWQIRLERIF